MMRGNRYLHGDVKSAEYRAWASLKYRCNNPSNVGYKNYGARGIKVCKRWGTTYLNFLEDMGRKPTPQHVIDRIDNDGNYEPNNCRWATWKESNNNRRYDLSYNGKTQTQTQWAEEVGISITCLSNRLNTYGWSIEKALTTPSRKRSCWKIKKLEGE